MVVVFPAKVALNAAARLQRMWEAYWIGLFLGIGIGLGGIGGVIGALAAALLVAGTLGRGGTRGGTSALVVGSGVVLAGLAFIPVVGYLEAAAVPVLTARARRRRTDRYAGLRTLARD